MKHHQPLFKIFTDYLLTSKGDTVFFHDHKTSFYEFFKRAAFVAEGLLVHFRREGHATDLQIGLAIDKNEDSLLLYFGCILARLPVYLYSPLLEINARDLLLEKWQLILCPSIEKLRSDTDDNQFSIDWANHLEEVIFDKLDLFWDRPICFAFTSGSSGEAKAIGLSLKNLWAHFFGISPFLKLSASDLYFLNLPTHHVGGLMIFWRALLSGAQLTFNAHAPYTIISLVPLQLERMLPELIKKKGQIKTILVGGAPLSSELKILCQSKGLKIFETYGMTETASTICINGQLFNGVNAQITSEELIALKGDMLSPSLKLNHDGYYVTRDLGFICEQGLLHFKGREDLLFKSGGELIDPLAVEINVKNILEIKDAYLIPLPHPKWGNAGALGIIFDESKCFSENEITLSGQYILKLKETLRQKLHPYSLPKYFFNLTPLSPLLGEGKISRSAVRKLIDGAFFHYKFIPNSNRDTLIVFFHGFMGNHTHLLPLEGFNQNCSVLFFDLPGHGKTPLENFEDRTFIFWRIKSFIESFGHKNIIFYGYSMGGRIALELALFYFAPNKLILESANLGPKDENERSEKLVLDQKLNIPSDPLLLSDFLKNQWYQNPIFYKYSQTARFLADLELQVGEGANQRDSWKKSQELFFSQGLTPYFFSEACQIISKLIEKSTMELFLIAGSQDEKYLNHYREAKEKIKKSHLIEIPDCGHNPHKVQESLLREILNTIIFV